MSQFPPADLQQPRNGRLVEAHAHDAGGVAGDDRVGRHVAHDGGARPDDGAVADRHARQDQAVIADPDVVPDHGVAAAGKGEIAPEGLEPVSTEDRERKGGRAVQTVVGVVHHELGARGDGADLADHQAVPRKREVIEDVAAERFRPLRIVVVGVVPICIFGRSAMFFTNMMRGCPDTGCSRFGSGTGIAGGMGQHSRSSPTVLPPVRRPPPTAGARERSWPAPAFASTRRSSS